MKQCVECRGLVPEGAETCPNCSVGSRLGVLKKLLVTTAISVSSCTSCLPYGVPPCPDGTSDCYDPCAQVLPDGGSPKEDPTSNCFTGTDGGSVDGGTP